MLLIRDVINRRKWNQKKREETLKKRLLRYAGSTEDKVKIVFEKENTIVTQKDLREKELLLQVFQ